MLASQQLKTQSYSNTLHLTNAWAIPVTPSSLPIGIPVFSGLVISAPLPSRFWYWLFLACPCCTSPGFQWASLTCGHCIYVPLIQVGILLGTYEWHDCWCAALFFVLQLPSEPPWSQGTEISTHLEFWLLGTATLQSPIPSLGLAKAGKHLTQSANSHNCYTYS